MRLTFISKSGSTVPEKLVADVEITFSDPDLAGIKLVGGGIWRGKKGDNYVSLPSRNGGGKFFDLLRYESDPLAAQALKANILRAYDDALAAGEVETVEQA